jgi:hypothetical protein
MYAVTMWTVVVGTTIGLIGSVGFIGASATRRPQPQPARVRVDDRRRRRR